MSWMPFTTVGTNPSLLKALALAGYNANGSQGAMAYVGTHFEDGNVVPLGEPLAGHEPCVIVGWTLESGTQSFASGGNTGLPFSLVSYPMPWLAPEIPNARLVVWVSC